MNYPKTRKEENIVSHSDYSIYISLNFSGKSGLLFSGVHKSHTLFGTLKSGRPEKEGEERKKRGGKTPCFTMWNALQWENFPKTRRQLQREQCFFFTESRKSENNCIESAQFCLFSLSYYLSKASSADRGNTLAIVLHIVSIGPKSLAYLLQIGSSILSTRTPTRAWFAKK